MQLNDDYGNFQTSDGNYSSSQNTGALYADISGISKKRPPAIQPAQPTPVQPSTILISVNAKSHIKAAQFVDIINKNKNLPAELKGKVKVDKNNNTIILPDLSNKKVTPGKEWIFNLGNAGNEWEVTTANLVLILKSDKTDKNSPKYWVLREHLQSGEDRGFLVGSDPEDGLIKPNADLEDTVDKLILGLAIPNKKTLDKNPPPPNTLPPPQIAELNNKKSLIIIANSVSVEKSRKVIKNKSIEVPKQLLAHTLLHEIASHASFFNLGQDAAHSDPLDPSNNVVDRNAEQIDKLFLPPITNELAAFLKKILDLEAATDKAIQ